MSDLLDMLREMEAARKAQLCPFCQKPPGEFRDALSRREFAISGLCQTCQDETFKEPTDD